VIRTGPSAEHWGPSRGPVVLDIGGEVGAAIVTADSSLDGAELEIRCPPGRWEGRHVAVRARPVPGRPVSAAVFAGLHCGYYEVRVKGAVEGPVVPVVVRGGQVATVTWPGSPAADEQGDGRKENVDVG
jgi:hypothetical protein